MKKLFLLFMVALLMGAMASCNSGKGGNAKTSALEDSITLKIGEFVGSQIKMAEQQGMDPNEILKGFETIAKLVKDDTTKAASSYNQGLMMGVQLFSGLPQQEQMFGKVDSKALLEQIGKTVKSKGDVDMAKMQALQMNLQSLSNRYMEINGKGNNNAVNKYTPDQAKDPKAEEAASEPATCSKCGGSGKVKCSKCGGKGTTRDSGGDGCTYGCKKCGGSGYAEGDYNNVRKGSGKMKCPECHGTGKV